MGTATSPARRRRSRLGLAPARVRLVAGVAAAAGLVLGVLAGWGDPTWWALPLLVVAVAAAEVAVVHLQVGRQRWTLSLTEAALAAAWVCAPGAWTAAAVVIGVGVAQLVRQQPRLKLEYNIAQLGAATAAGSLAAVLARQEVGAVAAAGCAVVAFFVVNHALVGLAVAWTTRRRPLALWRSSAPLAGLHTVGNASIGLLAAHLALTAPLGLLGLVVPLALVWTSYDQQTWRAAEAQLFAELARGQEQATGRSSDLSAQVVVTAAARLLGGADVEMVLLAPQGPVHYAGDETGVRSRARVDSDVLDEAWVVRALSGSGVRAGREQGRPWVSTVLGSRDAPLAVLLAQRPPGSAAFGRRELRLAEVLVGQAHSWLRVADLSARTSAAQARAVAAERAATDTARALGELSAATAPSLSVLHESATRLARLATQVDASTGVDEIVDELHLVERAVASLLGALALAAEPDLAVPAPRDGESTNRGASDWTTTGTLP